MTIELVAPSASLTLVVRDLLELVPGIRILHLGEESPDEEEDRTNLVSHPEHKEEKKELSPSASSLLSCREKEILSHVVEGLQNLEIASKLGISCRTVEFHRTNIKRKTGARNTADLVRYGMGMGENAPLDRG